MFSGNRVAAVLGKPFVSNGAVEPLNVRVLLELTGLDGLAQFRDSPQ
jgi:hypothetical protein